MAQELSAMLDQAGKAFGLPGCHAFRVLNRKVLAVHQTGQAIGMNGQLIAFLMNARIDLIYFVKASNQLCGHARDFETLFLYRGDILRVIIRELGHIRDFTGHLARKIHRLAAAMIDIDDAFMGGPDRGIGFFEAGGGFIRFGLDCFEKFGDRAGRG